MARFGRGWHNTIIPYMCHCPIWRKQSGFIMDESCLDVLFGCTPFSDVETQLSPIDGTKGNYISNNPSASIREETDSSLDLHSLGTASISAGINRSISEVISHMTAIVKEFPVKFCPLQIPEGRMWRRLLWNMSTELDNLHANLQSLPGRAVGCSWSVWGGVLSQGKQKVVAQFLLRLGCVF